MPSGCFNSDFIISIEFSIHRAKNPGMWTTSFILVQNKSTSLLGRLQASLPVIRLSSFPYHDDPPTSRQQFSNLQETKCIFLIEFPSLKHRDQEISLKKVKMDSTSLLGLKKPQQKEENRKGFYLWLLFTLMSNLHCLFWIRKQQWTAADLGWAEKVELIDEMWSVGFLLGWHQSAANRYKQFILYFPNPAVSGECWVTHFSKSVSFKNTVWWTFVFLILFPSLET